MQEGFAGVGRSLLGTMVGFEAVTKGAEYLVDLYRDQRKELQEVVAEQLKSRQELTQMLAMSGNLKQAPAVEKALEEIDTAKKDDKLAVFRSVSQAAPGLDRHKQTDLVKEIAPLAEILGTEGAGEVGKIAGTLSKVAPQKSMAELANLAHLAASHAGGRGAELGDEGSLRALQIFQKRVGMSVEEGLAFESEALEKGLTGKDVEKIGTGIDKDESIQQLAKDAKTPEGRAKMRFYREQDRHKRMEMLYHDKEIQRAILGDRGDERFGMMSEGGVASRAAEFRQGEGTFNAEELHEHRRSSPVEHELWTKQIAIERQKEGVGRKSNELLYKVGEADEELQMRREGRSGAYIKDVQEKERLAYDFGGAPAPGRTQALLKEQNERQTRERAIQDLERQKSLPGADKEDLDWRIKCNKQMLLDPEELDQQVSEARKNRGHGRGPGFVEGRPGDTSVTLPDELLPGGREPAPGREEHAGVSGQLLEHTAQQTQLLQLQTQLLQQLVAKPQSVAVNVHNGGGGSPRVDATARPEPSWSATLGADH